MMVRYLAVATLCLALSGTVNAGEQREPGDSSPQGALQELSREAQSALICQTVADWAAYEVTQLIRDDARDDQAISPEGMEVLSQIRLTEGLASAAFDALAPGADHDSMYRDAVIKMQAYLKEDQSNADANTRQMVRLCHQTYARMAAAGTLTSEQVQLAKDASQASVAKLALELQRHRPPASR